MNNTVFAGMAISLAVLAGAPALAAATKTAPTTAAATTAPATTAAPAKTKAPKIVKPVVVPDFVGSWAGPVIQGGHASPYTVDVTLSSKGGQTTYPDQHCTGKLARIAVSGGYAYYTETITTGKFDPATKGGCLDGSLTLEKDGTNLVMAWMTSHDGKAIVAYGSLASTK